MGKSRNKPKDKQEPDPLQEAEDIRESKKVYNAPTPESELNEIADIVADNNMEVEEREENDAVRVLASMFSLPEHPISLLVLVA